MSSKNTLQEHYMKRAEALPQYSSQLVGGESHAPIWRSTVVIKNGKQFVATGPSKSVAEQAAAQQACDYLFNKPSKSAPAKAAVKPVALVDELKRLIDASVYKDDKNDNDHKDEKHAVKSREKIVLVDADNITIPTDIPLKYPLVRFKFFVSRNSSKDTSGYTGKNCKIRVPPTVTKDAVDHLISFSAGMFVQEYPHVKLMIATKDHFGEALAALCDGEYVCSLKEFNEKIESFASE